MNETRYFRTKNQPRIEDLVKAGIAHGQDVLITFTDGSDMLATIEGGWNRHGRIAGQSNAHSRFGDSDSDTAMIVRRPLALAPTKLYLKDISEIHADA